MNSHSVLRPIRVFIHSRQNSGAKIVEEQFRKGTSHNPRPYGFEAAELDGELTVEFSESRTESRLQRIIFDYLQLDLIHAIRNISALRRADVVWTVLEWEWLAISLLQRLRLAPRIPVIGNSVWMMEHWKEWGRRRRWLFRWLMSDQIFLSLHSEEARRVALSELPDKAFHVIPFGVSALAFPTRPPRGWRAEGRPLRLFAMGHDRTRDWSTMLAAFGNDARFELRIMCRWIDEVVDVTTYSNLTVPRSELITDQRQCYEWADVVVMPMVPNVFSGITVACEAAAQGIPLVCSRTGGVPTYFSEDEALYVPPLQPDRLRERVINATPATWEETANRMWKRYLRSDYSAAGMTARYKQITKDLLASQR